MRENEKLSTTDGSGPESSVGYLSKFISGFLAVSIPLFALAALFLHIPPARLTYPFLLILASAFLTGLLVYRARRNRERPNFPIKNKSGEEGVTAFEAKWFGKFLAQMKEPPLPEFTKEANAEVYRMMILPTWGNAILVRVQKHGAIYSLSARRLGGQAGFELGKLVEAKDFELSADDSKALEQLIQNLSFFQLATDDGVLGADGDEWILEGVSQGKYHVAKRWCASSYIPNKRGLKPFLDLSRFLLNKSTL